MLLIRNGDIVALHCVCGLMLLSIVWFSRPALLPFGAILIALPGPVPVPLSLPTGDFAQIQIAKTREIYGGYSYVNIVRFRLHETGSVILPLFAGILPQTAGLMLYGIVGCRSGILRRPGEQRGSI